MAMVTCGECGAQVSDQAAACVQCGAPVAADGKAAGAALTTTQGTSKRLKLLTLVSWVMIIGGLAVFFGSMPEQGAASAEVNMTAFGVFAVGLLLLIVTKFRRWWHHA